MIKWLTDVGSGDEGSDSADQEADVEDADEISVDITADALGVVCDNESRGAYHVL